MFKDKFVQYYDRFRIDFLLPIGYGILWLITNNQIIATAFAAVILSIDLVYYIIKKSYIWMIITFIALLITLKFLLK